MTKPKKQKKGDKKEEEGKGKKEGKKEKGKEKEQMASNAEDFFIIPCHSLL